MRSAIKQRDCSIDALKFILICFVVYGHVIEEFSTYGPLGTVRACIYCFHMPVFVFLFGYFSKNISIYKIATSCLVPFLIFNSVYSYIRY